MIDPQRALEHAIPDLDRRGLRSFGLVTGGTIGGLFGLFFPWLMGVAWPVWPWIVFAVLWLAALLTPQALRPVHHGWMRFAILISKVTTPVILGVVFFFVFTPFGLIMRLFARDAMHRKFDDASDSYRVASKKSSKKHLENPY